jgi:uncharacterized membrane protein
MIDRLLRRAALVLAVIGVGIAGYLVYVHYAHVQPICSISHGCETVQKSRYAKLGGVPVALLGLVGYLAILVTLFIRTEAARLAGAAFALVGFGFSAWLTYLEAHRIHAWCQWCVASAIVMTLLMIVLVSRLLVSPPSSGADDVDLHDPAADDGEGDGGAQAARPVHDHPRHAVDDGRPGVRREPRPAR